jgi:hypothetical protein
MEIRYAVLLQWFLAEGLRCHSGLKQFWMSYPMTPIFSTHPDPLPYERRITEPQHKEVAVLAHATAALQHLPPALSTRTARSIEDLRDDIKRFLHEESARGRFWFGEVDGVTAYMM